jgi:hypothetical protein
MTVKHTPQGLQITRRWFSLAFLFLIPFASTGMGFLSSINPAQRKNIKQHTKLSLN